MRISLFIKNVLLKSVINIKFEVLLHSFHSFHLIKLKFFQLSLQFIQNPYLKDNWGALIIIVLTYI